MLTVTVIVPLGFAIVAAADPDVVLSTCDVAVTVTVPPPDDGTVAGAWNNPLFEIVPTVALPPATPFTLQFTAGLLFPVTVAVNCCSAPTTTVGALGETVTVKGAGANCRILEFSVSATNSALFAPSATLCGVLSSALVAAPPSPENPGVPFPAIV